jgi:predicted transcriptional regulator
MLKLGQKELAKLANVSEPTVHRLESKSGPVSGNFQSVTRLIEALESQGIIFTEDGVELRRPGTEQEE